MIALVLVVAMLLGFQDDGQLKAGNFARLDAGKNMGGQVVRSIMSRQATQRPNGSYDFSKWDAIVNNANARGLQVQLVLDNLEGFKRHGSGDPRKYEQFVRAAAQHFRGRVARYSLGNEPDLKMSPRKYRELYVRGYRAMNSVDPHARVLFGEFSPHGGLDYAARVLRAGKAPLHAAGLAIHPYQATDPLAPPGAGDNKWGIGRTGTMDKLLAMFAKHDGFTTRNKKTPGLYFTEFGYNALGGADPQAAARMWPRALQKAARGHVRELVAYTLTGSPGSPWDTGLTNYDGTPRPAYEALVNAVRSGSLRSAPRVRR